MNKKILFGLFLLTLTGQLTFGQTKVYNGSFNSSNFQGTSTYNYSEQPDKRIFNGPFTFKTTNNSVNISGRYLNNLKEGSWKYVLANIVNTDQLMKYIISANVVGFFKDGNADGNWTLSRTKAISFSNTGVSKFYQSNLNTLSYLFDGKTIDFTKTTIVVEKSSANFKDNHFADSYSYSINGGKSIINGHFNEQGYFDGEWTTNYYQDGILHFQKRNYLNGVLVTIKNKDNSTGEITTVYDKAIEVNEFFQNYNASENSSKIGNNYYNLIEGKTSESTIRFLEDAIAIWYNNTSLSESAYIFEIERGSNKLAVYPERIITLNNERTEKARKEEEQIAEEIIKKKEAAEEEKQQIQLAKVNQEKERLYEQERKRNEFERSNLGQLQKRIKIEFSAWVEKKEFESNQDYENRIKTKSRSEFDKIAQNKISESQEKSKRVSSGALFKYDVDNEKYQLKIFRDGSEISFTQPIFISIPKNIVQNLKQKFGAEKANYGTPLLVHVLDVTMIDNNWAPSRLLIIFPNGASLNSVNYNKPYYDSNYWQDTQIIINGKDGFSLKCPGSLNPVILKNISSQFNNSSLDEGVFYCDWQLNSSSSVPISFSIENLGIVLPIK